MSRRGVSREPSALPSGTVLIAMAASLCSAQNITSARSGTVHYFEGDVSIEGEPLVASPSRFSEVKEQEVLRTGKGRAEILLTPGVFLRVGENSAVRMLDNRLVSTRVEILSGSAMAESVDPQMSLKDSPVTLVYGDYQVRMLKHGLLEIGSDPSEMKVYKGEAEVSRRKSRHRRRRPACRSLAGLRRKNSTQGRRRSVSVGARPLGKHFRREYGVRKEHRFGFRGLKRAEDGQRRLERGLVLQPVHECIPTCPGPVRWPRPPGLASLARLRSIRRIRRCTRSTRAALPAELPWLPERNTRRRCAGFAVAAALPIPGPAASRPRWRRVAGSRGRAALGCSAFPRDILIPSRKPERWPSG